MRHFTTFLALLLGTLLARAARGQADTILRTNGTEVAGRVLSITPLELRYLPPASADTVRLSVAEVFMVRYANGTRELLHPVAAADGAADGVSAAADDLLPGLSENQRRSEGRRAAGRGYRDQGPFWLSFGSTLYAGPLLGVIAPAVIGPRPVALDKLHAPQPALLADPAYDKAYRQEAQRLKRSRAWGGFGAGVGAWVLLLAAVASAGP